MTSDDTYRILAPSAVAQRAGACREEGDKMSKVKHGRGWVLVEDVQISDELTKKLSERATHYYRDAKGNIINYIKCEEKGAVA